MKVEFDIASDQIDGARDYQEDAYMVNQLGDSDTGDLCALSRTRRLALWSSECAFEQQYAGLRLQILH